MLNRVKSHFLKFDWIIFSAIFLLSLFGLIEIYSIALGQETVDLVNFNKQIFAVALGLLSLFILSFIDYNFFRNYSKVFYVLGVALLLAVLFFGKTVAGSTRWIEIFGMTIQPVEFVKIIFIIFLARFFSNSAVKMRPLKTFTLSFLGTLGLSVLLLFQPDLGPVVLMFIVWFLVLMLIGFKRKYFLMIIIPFLLISFFLWNFYFKDYQKNRVLTFLNPGESTLSEGYNIRQALIAVGSGGVMGRGVGFGSQSQLKFLPEVHNDFIFSVISEELGFLGAGILLFIYFVLFWRILASVKKLNDDFAIFFVLGATALIFMEMFINIGMNIGMVPVVGMSLPFVSYGGSAILAKFALIGIVQNIIIKSKS